MTRLPTDARSAEAQLAPKLSVVVPTHNRRGLLEATLRALSEQTYPSERFEVIVVVDGSDDGTVEMLAAIDVPYCLKVHRQDRGGVSRARNAGIKLAAGEIILCIDDDIIAVPRLLAEHAASHERYECAVVLGRISAPTDQAQSGWSRWGNRKLDQRFRALVEGRRQVGGRHLYSANFSTRRDSLLAIGGFDESLSRSEDLDLGCRLEQSGYRFYVNSAAEGIHLGDHPYERWRNINYQYGRNEVVLARDREYSAGSVDVCASFQAASKLTRLGVAIFLDRRSTAAVTSWLLRHAAWTADLLKLGRLSEYLYGGIANLAFWQGVSDELGGRESFRVEVAHQRPANEKSLRQLAQSD